MSQHEHVQVNEDIKKKGQISSCSVHYLNKFGLYLAIRGNLLVC